MKDTQRIEDRKRRRAVFTMATVGIAIGMTVGVHAMMTIAGTGAKRPAASEFGPGPRASAGGLYVATLQPVTPLRPRHMQTVRVALRDADGQAVDEAQIAIDGGMPEHGHGLPTRPRVTRNLGDGVYEIEGVRFNMGGWWEFRLAVTASRGTDVVTFNLDL